MKGILNESFIRPDQKYRSVKKKRREPTGSDDSSAHDKKNLPSIWIHCIEMQYVQYLVLSRQDGFCIKKYIFCWKQVAEGPLYKFSLICKRGDSNLDKRLWRHGALYVCRSLLLSRLGWVGNTIVMLHGCVFGTIRHWVSVGCSWQPLLPGKCVVTS